MAKLFLQKGMRPKGKPQLKFILLAAVALVVLVIVAPLITRKKENRAVSPQTTQPASSSGSAVTNAVGAEKSRLKKETPKQAGGTGGSAPDAGLPSDLAGSPAPVAQNEGNPDGVAQQPTGEMNRPGETAGAGPSPAVPPAGRNPEWQPVPQGNTPTAEPQAVKPAGPVKLSTALGALGEKPKPAVPEKPKREAEAASAKKPAKPETASPAGAVAAKAGKPPAASKQVSAKTVQGKPAVPGKPVPMDAATEAMTAAHAPAKTAAKPAAGGKGGRYCVQVGTFKDKQNADEMVQRLQKKGYAVTVRQSGNAKMGSLYVVQLQPVETEGKASTQMEQIKNEQKVKPSIIRVQGGQ